MSWKTPAYIAFVYVDSSKIIDEHRQVVPRPDFFVNTILFEPSDFRFEKVLNKRGIDALQRTNVELFECDLMQILERY